MIGRPIGHQQDLRPAFGQRLGHIRVPSVLANGRANAQRPHPIRALQGRTGEEALFVKDPVIGQFVLQHGRRNLAALKDVIGVEKLPIAGQRAANTQRRTIDNLPG